MKYVKMTCPSKPIKYTSAIIIICPTQSNHVSLLRLETSIIASDLFIDHRKSNSIALEIILLERYLLIQYSKYPYSKTHSIIDVSWTWRKREKNEIAARVSFDRIIVDSIIKWKEHVMKTTWPECSNHLFEVEKASFTPL